MQTREKPYRDANGEAWYSDAGTEADRLHFIADMEDVLGDDYDLDRLRELVEADREAENHKNRELYSLAISTYGPEAQTVMVFEEMAELQKELCKHARGTDNREAIAEEIADVQIMLEQMIELHGCADAVLCYKRHKLERLAERIEHLKGEQNG